MKVAAAVAAAADLGRKGNHKRGAAVFVTDGTADVSEPAAVFPCTLDARIYRAKGLEERTFY